MADQESYALHLGLLQKSSDLIDFLICAVAVLG